MVAAHAGLDGAAPADGMPARTVRDNGPSRKLT